MKFEKKFFFSVIPEWKDRYLDYQGLCSQIKLIKKAALNLAKAYANIKAITGDEVDMEIKVDNMASDKVFWRMVEENLDKIEDFYKTQLLHFTEQFHILTLQAIRLGLLDEYEPFTRGLSTRLERELERLSLPGQIELSTLTSKDEAKESLGQEGYLFHLDRSTRVDEVIERIRHAGENGAFKAESHSSDDEDDSDDEEHARSRHAALKARLRRKQEETRESLGPESGYDSDKSEEQIADKRGRGTATGRARSLSSIKLRPLYADDVTGREGESIKMMQYGTPVGYNSGRFAPNQEGDLHDEELGLQIDDSESVEMINMGDRNHHQHHRHHHNNEHEHQSHQPYHHLHQHDAGHTPIVHSKAKPHLSIPEDQINIDSSDEYVDVDVDIDEDDIDIDDDGFNPPKPPKLQSEMHPPIITTPPFQASNHQQPVFDYDIDDDDRDDDPYVETDPDLIKPHKQAAMLKTSSPNHPPPPQHHQQQQQQQQQQPNGENGHPAPPAPVAPMKRKLSLSSSSVKRFSTGGAPAFPQMSKAEREKSAEQLKSAFSEFYRGLILLQNFATLNVEAVQKILKKHDKNIELGAREKFTQNRLTQFSFYRRRSLKALMRETEHVYAVCFTDGHRTDTMKVLRVPTEKKSVGVATFRFGLFLGLSMVLFAICIYLTTVVDTRLLDKMRPGLIVYRMLGVITLMLWYWGVDMYVWTQHRVNYVFIFEFNPRKHVRYQHVFEAAAVLTFVLMFNLLIFMLTAAQDGIFGWEIPGFTWLENIPPHLIPLTLLIMFVFIVMWIQIKSNFWLLRTLARIMAAPFIPVVFRDFFIADQILSIIISLQDLEYVICYYSTDAWTGATVCLKHQIWVFPLIAAFPSLWRFLQCIRRFRDSKDTAQLVNAAKYFTGLVVITTSALRRAFPTAYTDSFWFLAVFASTIFTFLWDVIKDWSLGNRNVKHCLLRSELLYPTSWYYMALILNLGMRLMWTLTISPDSVRGTLHPDVFALILAVVEMTRRAIWNMFRLENEQLTNCGKFRALKDIPLPLPVEDPRNDMD